MPILSYRDTEPINDRPKVMQESCSVAKELTHVFQPCLLVGYLQPETKFPCNRGKQQPQLWVEVEGVSRTPPSCSRDLFKGLVCPKLLLCFQLFLWLKLIWTDSGCQKCQLCLLAFILLPFNKQQEATRSTVARRKILAGTSQGRPFANSPRAVSHFSVWPFLGIKH